MLGERPPGMSLYRINPWGNYEPGNLRWANPKLQANNLRIPHPPKPKKKKSEIDSEVSEWLASLARRANAVLRGSEAARVRSAKALAARRRKRAEKEAVTEET